MEKPKNKHNKLSNIKKSLVWLIIPLIVYGVISILEEKQQPKTSNQIKPETFQNLINLTGKVIKGILHGK